MFIIRSNIIYIKYNLNSCINFINVEAALKLNRNIARQYAYFKKLFQVKIVFLFLANNYCIMMLTSSRFCEL